MIDFLLTRKARVNLPLIALASGGQSYSHQCPQTSSFAYSVVVEHTTYASNYLFAVQTLQKIERDANKTRKRAHSKTLAYLLVFVDHHHLPVKQWTAAGAQI